MSRYAKFAWFTLGYNLLVILWGAFVRVTGSGAGCGSDWPTCQGEIIPRDPSLETLIEFSHRITSGLALLCVVGLLFGAFRWFSKEDPQGRLIRKGAIASMVLMLVEALVGAGLVLFEYVADNDSIARAIWLACHLMNTFLLLGAITLTAWWATTTPAPSAPFNLRGSRLLLFGLVGMMILGASGAVTALGDTLFPAESLRAGFIEDFSPTAHILLRLRVWHPTLAIALGMYLILVTGTFLRDPFHTQTRLLARLVIGLLLTQIALGFLNLLLLAPAWMQLIHLLVADGLWITLVLLAGTSFRSTAAFVPTNGG